MQSKFLFTICSLFFTFLMAVGQTGKVRGFVIDKKSDAPIPFANALLEGINIGAVANDEGYFILNNVPVGEYTLKVSFVGYNTSTRQVTVLSDRIVSEKIYLEESSQVLEDVTISADRQARESKVLTSVISLNPKEIKQFSVGGDADIIKALQVLPGVITTGDQGGQLYIRGGAPIQNLITLDGMIIYNPFHSIGFFSVFDADIIQSADIYTGGFNAEYGSRNSAVMDVRTRPGNRKRFAGKATASTYTAKLLLETPLGRKNDKGLANTSFLVSAKTSYLDQTSSTFYPYVETEYDGLPFTFTDIYGKLTAQSDNGSKVNAFGFSFDDGVKFGGDNSIDWTSRGLGVDFTAVPSSSSALISGGLSYSNYNIISMMGEGTPSESSINSFNGGLDFTYFLRKNDEFKYGLEAIGYGTNLRLPNELGFIVEEASNTTELGGYFQYKLNVSRFLIQPGIRLHYYSSGSELSVEPRLGVKYNINNWLRIKAATGIYSQNLMASNSDRDIVNLFYGFLSGESASSSNLYSVDNLDTKLQKSKHLIAGIEIELSKHLTMNIEGYLKQFDQILNVNRNKIYDEDKPNTSAIFEKDYIGESGLAKGVDILTTYRTKNLYLWVAYSLGVVTRDDGIREYNPYFDRRHNLNMVGSYSFGKEKTWEASLRYNFGSGFPFTPTRTNYSKLDFLTQNGQPDLTYDYTTAGGEPNVLYGELNTKRLPNYHRVDISLTKVFPMKNDREVEASVGATNILNYENIFYYDRNERKRVNQLPIMPTISISYSF